MNNVYDLEQKRTAKAAEAVEEIIRAIGPITDARPLSFYHNGELWHLDKDNKCIRGQPKPHWTEKTFLEVKKLWPFAVFSAIFETGRSITQGQLPPVTATLVFVITAGYKAWYLRKKRLEEKEKCV